MKMFLISDNTDTLTGMRLAGVNGIILHERAEVEAKIRQLASGDEYGIILITERLRNLCGDFLNHFMLHQKQPLILEIPDRHGFGRSKTSMSDYIRKSIGLKL